jgi:hypothetical protein
MRPSAKNTVLTAGSKPLRAGAGRREGVRSATRGAGRCGEGAGRQCRPRSSTGEARDSRQGDGAGRIGVRRDGTELWGTVGPAGGAARGLAPPGGSAPAGQRVSQRHAREVCGDVGGARVPRLVRQRGRHQLLGGRGGGRGAGREGPVAHDRAGRGGRAGRGRRAAGRAPARGPAACPRAGCEAKAVPLPGNPSANPRPTLPPTTPAPTCLLLDECGRSISKNRTPGRARR